MPPRAPLHVFVTGSASGIGRRLCEVLIDRGHRVTATDVAEAALREHASARAWPAGRALVLALDVRDASAWERAYAAAEAHIREALTRFQRLDDGGVDTWLDPAAPAAATGAAAVGADRPGRTRNPAAVGATRPRSVATPA